MEIIDVDTTFMADGQEYKIIYKNEQKKRISIVPIGDTSKIPFLGQKIIINNKYYIATYIHETKKRISLDLMREKEIKE